MLNIEIRRKMISNSKINSYLDHVSTPDFLNLPQERKKYNLFSCQIEKAVNFDDLKEIR